MKKKLLWWFMVICSVILLMMAIFGCVATKNRKAVERVKNNTELLDKVGREWEKTHGCVTQTTVEYLPGKEVTTFDTSYSTEVILSTDSFETNTAVIRYKERIVTKTITRTDTIIKEKEDLRRLQLITGDLNRERGISATLKDQLKESRKQGTGRLLWMIGEGLLILLLGFLLFKQKK